MVVWCKEAGSVALNFHCDDEDDDNNKAEHMQCPIQRAIHENVFLFEGSQNLHD